ncbi:hypothetical protein H2203_005678 [Taxawa tesnikishii (nom. ined.)]|nr:hypothetical protein H2203_005678 [Dothideales sp. JES 119]
MSQHQRRKSVAIMSNSNTRDIKQVEGAVAARKNTPGRIEDGMSYEERLFHHAYRVGYEDPDFLMFRGLQTLNIINLQNELARCKADIWTKQAASEDSLQRIKRTMHEYANAMRDFEYMNQLRNINGSQAQEKVTDLTQAFPDIADLPSAPYNSQFRRLFQKPRTNTDPIRRRLKNILPRRITYTKEEMHERMDEFLHHQPPEDVSPAVDKLARFLGDIQMKPQRSPSKQQERIKKYRSA